MRTIFLTAIGAILILAAFSGCTTTVRTPSGSTSVSTHAG